MIKIITPKNTYAKIENTLTGKITEEKISEISGEFIYIGSKSFEKSTNKGFVYLKDRVRLYNELIIKEIYEKE